MKFSNVSLLVLSKTCFDGKTFTLTQTSGGTMYTVVFHVIKTDVNIYDIQDSFFTSVISNVLNGTYFLLHPAIHRSTNHKLPKRVIWCRWFQSASAFKLFWFWTNDLFWFSILITPHFSVSNCSSSPGAVHGPPARVRRELGGALVWIIPSDGFSLV